MGLVALRGGACSSEGEGLVAVSGGGSQRCKYCLITNGDCLIPHMVYMSPEGEPLPASSVGNDVMLNGRTAFLSSVPQCLY